MEADSNRVTDGWNVEADRDKMPREREPSRGSPGPRGSTWDHAIRPLTFQADLPPAG